MQRAVRTRAERLLARTDPDDFLHDAIAAALGDTAGLGGYSAVEERCAVLTRLLTARFDSEQTVLFHALYEAHEERSLYAAGTSILEALGLLAGTE